MISNITKEELDNKKFVIKQDRVETRPPRDGEGLPFDQLVVREGDTHYLYVNVGDRWIKFKEA